MEARVRGRPQIFFIADAPEPRASFGSVLAGAGYDVAGEASDVALDDFRLFGADAILIDRAVVHGTASLLCRALKTNPRTSRIPILVLDDREEESFRLGVLDAGADGCTAGRADDSELILRTEALLWRTLAPRQGRLAYGDIELDERTYRAWYRGRALNLTATELRLLKCLLLKPETVLTREEILEFLGQECGKGTVRTVDWHISRIRRAIAVERADEPIRTVRALGYMLTRRSIA